MKLTYLGVGFLLLLLVACSGKEAVQTKESMIEELQLFEDSLKNCKVAGLQALSSLTEIDTSSKSYTLILMVVSSLQ